jgi:2-amino-4-hydroxy-6-hydroxymethyldihydropteridine diphosphokinase
MPPRRSPRASLQPRGSSVVIGLGSNLGDRARHLAEGLRALQRLGTVPAVSSLYETEPVGGPPQGPYLNAAAVVRVTVSLRAVLDHLLAAEAALGRVRRERWAPRVLDLDLLWAGNVVVTEPALEVPHPRLCDRRFALVPLLEVVPDALDPRTGEPYQRALAALPEGGIRRVGPFPTTARVGP